MSTTTCRPSPVPAEACANLEAEACLLGSVILESEILVAVRRIVSVDSFYSPAHQTIFSALLALFEQGTPIDAVTLHNELLKRDALARVGGPDYIAQVFEEVPSPANAEHYAGIVQEQALRRRMLEGLDRARARLLHPAGDEVKDIVREALDGLGRIAAVSLPPEAQDQAPRPLVIPAAELRADPLGWLVRSFLPLTMLVLLSGRDKRGKTLLALELARAVLLGERFLGQFEVRKGRVLAALLDDPTSITVDRLAKLGIREHPELFVVDLAMWNLDDGLDRLRSEAQRLRPSLIILDALFHFLPAGLNAANDASRMTPIMRVFDALAVETGATVLLVCHDDKAGRDVAGSHVIRATAKQILRLTLPRETDDTEAEPDTPQRVLTVEGKLEAARKYLLEVGGPGKWTHLGDPRDAAKLDLRGRVRRAIENLGEEATADAVCKSAGGNAQKTRDLLKSMVENGEAQVNPVPTATKPRKVYRVGNPSAGHAAPTPPDGIENATSPTGTAIASGARDSVPLDGSKGSPNPAGFSGPAPSEGWTTGPIESCVVCGRGCAARDPKGSPRHPDCDERR